MIFKEFKNDDLKEKEDWYSFNDFEALEQNRIPNVLFFNMEQAEFDCREGDYGNCKEESEWRFSKDESRIYLHEQMKYFYSKEHQMRISVSVFAAFVFFLPVFLNYFG